MSNGEPGCKDLVQQGSASLSLNYLSSSDENMTEKTVWEKKKRKKERKGDEVKSIFYICILRPVYMIVGGRRCEAMRDELFLILK